MLAYSANGRSNSGNVRGNVAGVDAGAGMGMGSGDATLMRCYVGHAHQQHSDNTQQRQQHARDCNAELLSVPNVQSQVQQQQQKCNDMLWFDTPATDQSHLGPTNATANAPMLADPMNAATSRNDKRVPLWRVWHSPMCLTLVITIYVLLGAICFRELDVPTTTLASNTKWLSQRDSSSSFNSNSNPNNYNNNNVDIQPLANNSVNNGTGIADIVSVSVSDSDSGHNDDIVDDRQRQLNEMRHATVERLWNITNQFNVLYEANWSALVELEMRRYELLVELLANGHDVAAVVGVQ